MPRKSAALRLSQSSELLQQFEDAGLGSDYRGRFIRDMVSRLSRKKGLSKRQRDWLDSLIEEGVPAPKGDKELLGKIESAIDLRGMQDDVKILKEFAGKVRNGWNLSEKQLAWLSKMLEKADHIRENGVWEPPVSHIEKLKACALLGRAYSGTYWSTHRRTYYAWQHVVDYLSCIEQGVDAIASEYKMNIVLKQFNKKLEELFDSPRFPVGSICFVKMTGETCLVSGDPFVSDEGDITYPLLVGGLHKDVKSARLGKRNPRRK